MKNFDELYYGCLRCEDIPDPIEIYKSNEDELKKEPCSGCKKDIWTCQKKQNIRKTFNIKLLCLKCNINQFRYKIGNPPNERKV